MSKANHNINQSFIEDVWEECQPTSPDESSHDEFMAILMAGNRLDKDIQPSVDVKERFYSEILHSHQKQAPVHFWLRIRSVLASIFNAQPRLVPQFLTIVVAFTCGILVHSTFQSTKSSHHEQQTLKNLLVIALLNQPAASDRLTAFNFIDATSIDDVELTSHLLDTLNEDDSDGIRLAALKHLEHSIHLIRKDVLDALKNQQSILVQMIIISMLTHDHPLTAAEIELIRSMENIDDQILKSPLLKLNIKTTTI